MTDPGRLTMLRLLRNARPAGVHTLEFRRAGVSGNPSARRAELVARGAVIRSTPRKCDGIPGRLFTLVRDISDERALFTDSELAGLDAGGDSASVEPGGATPIAEGPGASEPARPGSVPSEVLCWVWDKGWRQMPASELELPAEMRERVAA